MVSSEWRQARFALPAVESLPGRAMDRPVRSASAQPSAEKGHADRSRQPMERACRYRDWGDGQPVVFSHGWPLSGEAWDEPDAVPVDRAAIAPSPTTAAATAGLTSQAAATDMDTLRRRSGDADRQARPRRHHPRRPVSTGGGEVARYVGRHGTDAACRPGHGQRHRHRSCSRRRPIPTASRREVFDRDPPRPARRPRANSTATSPSPSWAPTGPARRCRRAIKDDFWRPVDEVRAEGGL